MSARPAWMSLPLEIPAILLVLAVTPPAQGPAGEAGPVAPKPPSLLRAFDWTVGAWSGVRRHGAGGSPEEMTMTVEPILAGDGQMRRIVVGGGNEAYHGFAVQVPDAARGVWIRRYVSRGRGSFSSLEGRVEGTTSTWVSVTPGRVRESRLVSRLGPDGVWTRTMSVSDDGGRTWRVLWNDRLEKAAERHPPQPGARP